ncbi:MAG: ABC transporter substrate-binding protein [Nitrosopumilus sp.]|nr:ABC transporter substrate-binding protein [Nitrosopumilus sp.]
MKKSIYFYIFLSCCLSFLYPSCSPKTTPPPDIGSYVNHKVKPGESMISIARKYKTEVEEIRKFNPHIAGEVRSGMTIRIPVVSTPSPPREEESTEAPDIVTGVDTFKIACLLPFNMESAEVFNEDNSQVMLESNSKIILEFYEGMLLAIDSLKKEGLIARLYVHDTKNSNSQVSSILAKPEMKQMDVIIGPAFSTNITAVAEFAEQNKIKFVSPLSSTPYVAKDFQRSFQIIPSVNSQISIVSDYLSSKYGGQNFVLINPPRTKERELANMFRDALGNGNGSVVLSTVNYPEQGEEVLISKLKKSLTNILIIPSSDEAYVSNLISQLYMMEDEFDIMLFGLPTWEKFETLDFNKLQDYKVHYFSTTALNDANPLVNTVKSYYMKQYKSEPSIAVYQGYDTMYLIGKSLMKHGRNFFSSLDQVNYTPAVNSFRFVKAGNNGGIENQSVTILTYENFQLVRKQ